MRSFCSKVWTILLLSFWGLANANAQFLEDTETVDIVQIPGFNSEGNMAQYYLADLGTATDSVAWSLETGEVSQWYKIPAGGVSDSTTNVQAYYYKNVATGRYLYISDEVLDQLAGDDGDWPTQRAQATDVNAKAANFKWFDRPSQWGWGIYISNAAGINLTKRDGNHYVALTGIILMKVNDGGINGEEFFGVYEPNASVGSFAGGLGNAWTAVKTPVVVVEDVANPDIPHFLKNTETVDIVQIPGFNNNGNMAQYYLADLGTAIDSVAWSLETGEISQWYKIPAGGVSDSTTDVQAYYYKNVATGRYLYISDEVLSQLAGDDGDWPTQRAQATDVNAKTANFKWFDRPSPWGWGIYISNAAGINLTKRDGNHYVALTGIILMKINDGGINGEEFFGVYEPNASVGSFAGGLSNAWTAVKTPVVAEEGVANPDHRPDNARMVDVIQITTWMTPNNAKLGGATPYAIERDGYAVYSTDAASDSTKWYEIPAGEGAFGQQVYYYKNLVTGAYLAGSTRTPGEGGDWTVSAATTSATNEKTALYKWSKVESNWGNGPWLVNEQGNTGTRPSGDNKNPFFAFTMLTGNSEFFGVDVPNIAVSNPHDGGNAWTAVKINVVYNVANPDYKGQGDLPDEDLPIDRDDDLGSGYGSSYVGETHTVTFDDAWQGRGWWFGIEPGRDLSGYRYVVVEFEPVDFQVQTYIEYNDPASTHETSTVKAGAKRIVAELNNDLKANVRQVLLQSSAAGSVVLNRAYLTNKDPRKPDLVISDISWTPANPVLGDSILFSATIKNIGDAATAGVKHGVVFGIKLPTAEGNGMILAWSDTHRVSLAAGDSVTVTANGGPGATGAAKWKPGIARDFAVVAQINDTRDVMESNYDNNILTKIILVKTATDVNSVVHSNGKVFVADGKLHVVNFPENALVSIYNLQAQKTGDCRASETASLSLPKGLYIVRIQDGDQSSNFKVLIK